MVEHAKAGTGTDLIFNRPVDSDKPAPRIDRQDLGEGAIVKYMASRIVEYTRRGVAVKNKMHVFASCGGDGPWFSIWGSQQLDSQLQKALGFARGPVVILLKYLGQDAKALAADEPAPHRWQVILTSATMQQILDVRVKEWAERERLLLDAITLAAEREKARREARNAELGGNGSTTEGVFGGMPSQEDDDHLPF